MVNPSLSKLSGPVVFLMVLSSVSATTAQEQRATPPTFAPAEFSRVFFPKLGDAIRGSRPTLASLRATASGADTSLAASSPGESAVADGWGRLISPLSLEDEIKRVKLTYDAVITTPGAFNGGGYQEARLNLSVLATLMAVIAEYGGDVRWKKDAPAARDLIARTARNCAAGSTQVYNEAKLRKADLQDLIAGSGLTVTQPPESENDWSMIADRSPLMQYAEQLLDGLSADTRDAGIAEANAAAVKRRAELIAVLGEVITKEGMDDYDDADYAALSGTMTAAARKVADAVDRQDFASLRESVGGITQSCADCHEQYR